MKQRYIVIICVLIFANLIMSHNIMTLYKQECKTKNKNIHKKINNGDIKLVSDMLYITLVIIVAFFVSE